MREGLGARPPQSDVTVAGSGCRYHYAAIPATLFDGLVDPDPLSNKIRRNSVACCLYHTSTVAVGNNKSVFQTGRLQAGTLLNIRRVDRRGMQVDKYLTITGNGLLAFAVNQDIAGGTGVFKPDCFHVFSVCRYYLASPGRESVRSCPGGCPIPGRARFGRWYLIELQLFGTTVNKEVFALGPCDHYQTKIAGQFQPHVGDS